MKLILIISAVLAPVLSNAAECKRPTAPLAALTARFVALHPELKTDYAIGTDRSENDVNLLTEKFSKRAKTDSCRESEFGALIGLFIASSPFSQDSTGASFAERTLSGDSALQPAFKQALTNFTKTAGNNRDLACRAQTFAENVKAFTCNRVTPKELCFSKLTDFAKCANLPELGSQ